MLLANNPGSWKDVYPPLLHAPWHGWTATDLIFPCFLWMVGVAMTLSFARRVEQGADRGALFRHAVRRSLILVGLGLFLTAFPFGLLPSHRFSLETLRLPGVLQRIGLCYLAASAIFLTTRWRGQAAWAAALLAGYGALLLWVPVPGYGPGVLEPKGNLAWWVDSNLLAGHTWSGAPAPGFDPEGLLSTLPAIATTLLGALSAHLLRLPRPARVRMAWVAGTGLGLIGLGLALDAVIPINKNLWTPSFAIFTAGASAVLLAAFHLVIDDLGWKRWATPLVVFGVNAIVAFVLAGLVARLLGLIRWEAEGGRTMTLKGWIYDGLFVPWLAPMNASLAFAVAFLAAMYPILWLMWKRGWLVKI
jgi:predicted acyltransferase